MSTEAHGVANELTPNHSFHSIAYLNIHWDTLVINRLLSNNPQFAGGYLVVRFSIALKAEEEIAHAKVAKVGKGVIRD